MKRYIIITKEGRTEGPNVNFEINNCQVIGIVENVESEDEALKKVLIENDWIFDAGFNVAEFELFEVV